MVHDASDGDNSIPRCKDEADWAREQWLDEHAREFRESISDEEAWIRQANAPGGARKSLVERVERRKTGSKPKADAPLNATLPEPGTQIIKPARINASFEAEVHWLASLSPVEYEKTRKSAAKRLKIEPHRLDKLIEKERAGETEPRDGQALALSAPEPWPEPVDGQELLAEIVAAIKLYVVIDDHSAIIVALWIIGTHVFDLFTIFPRLAITAPVMRCGKTTALDVIRLLVPRPLPTANISPAGVFRIIEKMRPTLLIDEFDQFLGERKELIGILNAGHRQGEKVVRCVGDRHEPRAFDVFTPAAFAGIGKLPLTLADRSVDARLRRKRPEEKVLPFRVDRTEHLAALARKISRWTADCRLTIAAADPDLPLALGNRAADNWRPLIAIADAVGGVWLHGARTAAEASARFTLEESKGVLLLEDARSIFDERNVAELFTKELIDDLKVIEERPWREWQDGFPISPRQIAALLEPFEIRPKSVRRGDQTAKGYKRVDCEDAFSRYLKPSG